MRIAVHGSTGAQGAPVVSELRDAGHDVVALARQPREGVTVADLGDSASLRSAYLGADAVFLHLPIPTSPDAPGQWVPAVLEALAASDVERVVLSTSGAAMHDAGPSESLQARLAGNRAFVEGLQAVVGSVVTLAPRLYLENLLLPFVAGPAVGDGVLAYPLAADKPISWISHRDVARAARVGFESTTEPGVYDLGLPAAAGQQLADQIGAGIGRAVTYEPITPAEFAERATPVFGPEMAAGVAGLYETFATDHTLEIEPNRPQLAAEGRLTIESWAGQSLSGPEGGES